MILRDKNIKKNVFVTKKEDRYVCLTNFYSGCPANPELLK